MQCNGTDVWCARAALAFFHSHVCQASTVKVQVIATTVLKLLFPQQLPHRSLLG